MADAKHNAISSRPVHNISEIVVCNMMGSKTHSESDLGEEGYDDVMGCVTILAVTIFCKSDQIAIDHEPHHSLAWGKAWISADHDLPMGQ
jgi:hypothetical protein